MKLATERELEDASLAEEVTVVEGPTFALSSKARKSALLLRGCVSSCTRPRRRSDSGDILCFRWTRGREAADYAADNLHDNILREVNDVGSHLDPDEFMKQVKAAMIKGFLATDQEFLSFGDLRGGQLPRQHTFVKAEFG